MTPATYDFTWVRGSTTPLTLSFKVNNVAIPYTDVRLTVFKGKVLAFRLSLVENPGTNPGTVQEGSPGVITFFPTAAQTRSLILSKNDGSIGKNSYEVELRNGNDEEVYLLGVITGIGGLNDDEA